MTIIAKLFKGGVHPWEGKELSSSKPIQTAPLFDKYTVVLQQHIGAPAKLVVKMAETVKKGQLIAASGGFISANIHAPTSGKVKIIECPTTSGVNSQAVEITADGNDEWHESVQEDPNWEKCSVDEWKKRISDAGVVGMGGAAFPTHVKLSPPPNTKIDTLILNGAECEPFLTADHRLMLEESERMLQGIQIMAKILNVTKVYIGIENNKIDAIEKLNSIAGNYGVEIVPLRVRYPQGAEKQLIYAITGREIPSGALPSAVGCGIQNVGTAAAVADAVIKRIPLIERITTVTGTPVCEPGNWKFKIGTPISKVLELAGGIKEQPAKMIMGGPMMGAAVASLDITITKNASGLLLLAKDEVAQYTSHPCIRCGRCTDSCPMSLMPGTLSVMIESENFDQAEYTNVMDCVKCGSCAYVCPAKRPLVQHMMRGQSEVIANRKKNS